MQCLQQDSVSDKRDSRCEKRLAVTELNKVTLPVLYFPLHGESCGSHNNGNCYVRMNRWDLKWLQGTRHPRYFCYMLYRVLWWKCWPVTVLGGPIVDYSITNQCLINRTYTLDSTKRPVLHLPTFECQSHLCSC